MPAVNTETQLRRAVIDRLIAASLQDSKPAREATLERWRRLGGSTKAATPAPRATDDGLG